MMLTPWSFCIMGSSGVNAKRPMPMATASMSAAASATGRAEPLLMVRSSGSGGILVGAAGHHLHGAYGHRAGPQQVHGRDDHLSEPDGIDRVALDVEQEVLALHMAAVGEVHAECEL